MVDRNLPLQLVRKTPRWPTTSEPLPSVSTLTMQAPNCSSTKPTDVASCALTLSMPPIRLLAWKSNWVIATCSRIESSTCDAAARWAS